MQKEVLFPNLLIFRAILFCTSLTWISSVSGTTYYVSSSGNDFNSGQSIGQSWASITKINQFTFQPGDSILFEGGSSFVGNLSFLNDGGTASQPIFISRYGSQKAEILAGSSYGIHIFNAEGFHISHLRIVGDGRSLNDTRGIYVHGNQPGQVFRNFELDSLEISGFNRGGISFGDSGNLSGFEDIRITRCEVFENGDHGIEIERPAPANGFVHKDIYIAHCVAHNNPGQLGKNYHHTGNGIMVGNADSVLIEYNEAYENGAENTYNVGGPVGIWVWDCNHANIQYNESHHNRTGSQKDGGGLDLDGGTINSFLQYNYSHDNEGAGILIAAFDGARPTYNNSIRYNISENDARKNGYGALHIWRGNASLHDIYIHNNTFYVDDTPNMDPRAVRVVNGGMQNIQLCNNIFVTENSMRLVEKSHKWNSIYFKGNTYFPSNGNFIVRDGPSTYTSLAAWRNNTNHEKLANNNPVGYQGDPMLLDMGNGGTIGNPLLLSSLIAYHLMPGSPLEDLGLNMDSLYSVNMGPKDYYSNFTPINSVYDVGAYEGLGTPLALYPSQLNLSKGDLEQIRLDWQFSPELDVVQIEIERRSPEQNTFKKIAQLPGFQRFFLDSLQAFDNLYYRLHYQLADGQWYYSRVREWQAAVQANRGSVFPNPVKDQMHIFFPNEWEGTARVEIYGQQGALIQESQIDLDQYPILTRDMQGLTDGVYILRLVHPKGAFQQKFVKG